MVYGSLGHPVGGEPTGAPTAAELTIKATVADQAARYALTTDDVQNGDYVYQTDTGILYAVTDQTALDGAGGYTAQTGVWMQAASSGQSGYLTNTDWSTFNGKQAALGGLEDVTGMSGISGILKVASGVPSAAVAGTDYYAPGGTDVALADGGSGASTAAGARTNFVVAEGLSTTTRVTVGPSAVATEGAGGVAVGPSADATGTFSVAVGYASDSNGYRDTVAIGGQASLTGDQGIAIGKSATAAGDAIAIGSALSGAGATAAASSIAIGPESVSSAANTVVFGSTNFPMSQVYGGKGYSNTAPATWGIYGTRASGSAVAGGDLVLAGGNGTDGAWGGLVRVQASPKGTLGSGLNALVDVAKWDGAGVQWISEASTDPTTGQAGFIGLFWDGTDLKFIKPDNSVATVTVS